MNVFANHSQNPDSPLITTSPFASRAPKAWQRVEAFLERGSEWLNPILIKEARQAFKSRQFMITFSLLLICGLIWSLTGLAILSGGAYFAPSGRFMLMGYFWIMAFPLTIIVPFSAFRSLASEREDGTYELLSITTLRPRQIIGGKLGSSVLQILIYLSALSPCLAFTYLLRGVDILTIAIIIFWSFMASVLLATFGLLCATLSRARHWQIVLMVTIILALAGCYLFGSAFVTEVVLFNSLPIDLADFWIGQLTALSAWVALFGLIFLAAAARITFVGENRSTKLRVWMLIVHWGMLAWFVYGAFAWDGESEAMIIYVLFALTYWWVLGSMMTGERTELSPRVQRDLPQSFMGRVFLTFFQPGPGTGYLFAISQCTIAIIACIAIVSAMTSSVAWNFRGGIDFGEMITTCVVFLCYVVIYVGIGRLIMRLFGRVIAEGPVVALLLNAILVALGVLVPFIVQFSLAGRMFSDDYTSLQISNVFWTMIEALEGDIMLGVGPSNWVTVPNVLLQAALVVLAINLIVAAPEIAPPRAPVPVRVQEDDLELSPILATAPTPTNPWDQPDPS
jgi:hypothetical protein